MMARKRCPCCGGSLRLRGDHYKCKKQISLTHKDGTTRAYPCFKCPSNAVFGKWDDILLDPEDIEMEIVESDGQKMGFRVGLVFKSGGAQKEPGLWIDYQERYGQSELQGPLLVSVETWNVLKREIDRRIRRFNIRQYKLPLPKKPGKPKRKVKA